MGGDSYQGYWKHKIEKLWREVEDLKERVSRIESGSGPTKRPKRSVAPPKMVPVIVNSDSGVKPPAPVGPGESSPTPGPENPILMVLNQGGPQNIVDINANLRDNFDINESVRDTLFNRVKGLMQEGKVEYDKETQRFSAR